MRKADQTLAAITVSAIASLLLYLWFSEVEAPALLAPEPLAVAAVMVLFVLNLVANVLSRSDAAKRRSDAPWSLAVSAVSAVLLMLIFVPGICGILWILLVAQLPRYYGWHFCLLAAIVVPLLVGVHHEFIFGRPYAMINVGLYTLFNLFVVYLGFTLESEKKARLKASQLVAELRATQQLLASASKRDERLRIARELHDLSGHHLSALSLQLEVARHSDGEKHQHAIERAGFIAHLLLSELRQTVSDFRQQRSLDMASALHALIERLPRPQVWLSLPASLHIDDVAMAETVLRLVQEALTNIVRHSDAERACIVFQQQDQQLTICIEDGGGEQTSTFAAAVTPGNGLSGMQERIAACGGELTIRQGDFGFRLDVRLPLGSGLIV